MTFIPNGNKIWRRCLLSPARYLSLLLSFCPEIWSVEVADGKFRLEMASGVGPTEPSGLPPPAESSWTHGPGPMAYTCGLRLKSWNVGPPRNVNKTSADEFNSLKKKAKIHQLSPSPGRHWGSLERRAQGLCWSQRVGPRGPPSSSSNTSR